MKITYIKRKRDQRKKRVAAYCRVSTTQSSQEESFDTQVKVYTDYIRAQTEWEFAGIYSDEKSAIKAENRDGFQQMIREALSGRIDLILVKSISRFSRNIVDCQKYVALLKESGVDIYFEKEGIHTQDPSTNMIFSLMGAIAQDESRSIGDNIRWSYHERHKRGTYNLGNNRVLGYDSIRGILIPNRSASMIRMIFQLYLKGKSESQIARYLKEQGLVGRMQRPLTVPGITYILSNEIYVGDRQLQKQAPINYLTKRPDTTKPYESYYFENDHEPIIDRTTWNAVKAKRESRKYRGLQHECQHQKSQHNESSKNNSQQNRSQQNNILQNKSQQNKSQQYRWSKYEFQKQGDMGTEAHASHAHYLYGTIICGLCGAPMTRRTLRGYSKTASKASYYKAWTCTERHKGRSGNGCKNRTIREEALLEVLRSRKDATDKICIYVYPNDIQWENTDATS